MKQMQANIAVETEVFRAWFANTTDAIAVLNESGNIRVSNQSLSLLLGYSARELSELTVENILPHLPSFCWNAELDAALEEPARKPRSIETLALTKSGQTRAVMVHFSKIVAVGRPFIVATLLDKRLLQPAKDEDGFLAAVASNLHDPLIVTDKDSRITRWNQGAENLLGWKSEDVLGKPSGDVLRVMYPIKNFRQRSADLKDTGYWQGEATFYNKQNKKLIVLATQSVLKDAAGCTIGNLALLRDITARKEAEDGVRKSNNVLEQKLQSGTSAIKKEKTLFRSVLAHNGASVTLFDKDLRTLYSSPSAKKLTGTSVSFYRQLHPQDEKKFSLFIEKLKQTPGKTRHITLRTRHKLGHYVWLRGTCTNMLQVAGVNGIVANLADISLHKRHEARMLQADWNFRSLAEQSADGIFRCDKRGKLIAVNAAALNLYGGGKEEFAAALPPDLVWETDPHGHRVLGAALQSGKSIRYESSLARKDGSSLPLEIRSRKSKDGTYIFLLHDLSERKLAEEKIRVMSKELKQLNIYLREVRQEERRRIGHEIHDELGQQLTAVKMAVVWLEKHQPLDNKDRKAKFRNIIQLLDESNLATRKILTELIPVSLEKQSLVDALRWVCERFTEQSGIDCELKTVIGDAVIAEPFTTAIFRIYQESLSNIARHSAATKVLSKLFFSHSLLTLTVEDNGKGFDVNAPLKKDSFGLQGIRERVSRLNGSFLLRSAPGKGTAITVKIPTYAKH